MATSAASGKRRNREILTIVFITIFLDLVGFGILIPIQPFYAESFGARPTTITLLGAVFSLVQFVFAPFLGRASDRVGRRPIMLITIAANVLGYLLFATGQSLFMLFVARAISGFGSANLATAQAIIADHTEPEKRAKGMGIVGAAFGLGFILGPAIGGVFGQFGLAVPAFVAAILSTVNFAVAFWLLPETRRAAAPETSPEREVSETGVSATKRSGLSWSALKEAVALPNVAQLYWIYFVGTVAFSLMEQVLGLFIERTWVVAATPAGTLLGPERATDPLRKAVSLTAYFLVLVGITLSVVQGLLIGRLARRFGESRLVVVGTAVVCLGLALIPVFGSFKRFSIFLTLAPIIAVGSGIYTPSIHSLLSKSTSQGSYGGALGLGQSLSALGRVIGPALAGPMFELRTEMPFLLGSVLMLTCVVAAARTQTHGE